MTRQRLNPDLPTMKRTQKPVRLRIGNCFYVSQLHFLKLEFLGKLWLWESNCHRFDTTYYWNKIIGIEKSVGQAKAFEKKSNLRYTRLIPLRVLRVSGAHLRGFAPVPTLQRLQR